MGNRVVEFPRSKKRAGARPTPSDAGTVRREHP